MPLKLFKNTVLFLVIIALACGSNSNSVPATSNSTSSDTNKEKDIVIAANMLGAYLPLLQNKNVGVVANQTSVIFKQKVDSLYEVYPDGTSSLYQLRTNSMPYTHIVDSLLKHNINIKKVYAPEHGFRGMSDAGEIVTDGLDTKTQLPVISIYGSNKKPNKEQLKGIDIILFDIQDVGARFYTYISTLHYVMEACAEQGIKLIVLDRPNPNAHYVDGPLLEKEHESFVGMHPIPIVHGMTMGEYAKMINGENWLKNEVKCQLTVIKMDNYHHKKSYDLPIKPSPNLPNAQSINLYSSICLFEGTNVSVGRGTDKQFQIIGSPYLKDSKYNFKFTPSPKPGAKTPKHNGILCYGYDLSTNKQLDSINLSWLIEIYNFHKENYPDEKFFTPYFTTLAGTKKLQEQLEAGWTSEMIKASWQKDLEAFKAIRSKYLIYD